MRVKMNDGWKKAGWIGLGAVLGLLLSLNFSALAERDARLPVPYEDLQLFSAVFGRIKSDYVEPVSDDKLIREAINGMVHGLDPHSDFLDADAYKELQISTQGKFGGLGIEVGQEDGIIKVISPIEETPAFRAGIKSGDLIIKIDDTVTRGLSLSKAWCSTCAVIRAACSTCRSALPQRFCRPTRSSSIPTDVHPMRACASRRVAAITCVVAAKIT